MRAAVGIARGVSLSVGILLHSSLLFTQPQSQAPPPAQIETFTGTTVNVPRAGEQITIRLSRWSTDADRDRLLATFTEKGIEGVQAALAAAQTLGYVWTTDALGYSVRYAIRIRQPDGATRIIVATDRKLDLAGPRASAAKPADPKADDYPFTVIELRLKGKGTGEGRTSLTSKIGVDAAAKTIALESYEKATVVLKDVKEESRR